tara:strand:- start:148 stop:384 length:237 start_codon:yes stop_codon:yes gene_type:complete
MIATIALAAMMAADTTLIETTLTRCTVEELNTVNSFMVRAEVKSGEPICRFEHGDTVLTMSHTNTEGFYKLEVLNNEE